MTTVKSSGLELGSPAAPTEEGKQPRCPPVTNPLARVERARSPSRRFWDVGLGLKVVKRNGGLMITDHGKAQKTILRQLY